jgi:mannose-6-phosphate isomerase-like protein (cupin superfamily)
LECDAPDSRDMTTHFFNTTVIDHARAAAGKRYVEFLRVPAMSAGLYALAKDATDPQKPHNEDELYYVIRGRARMRIGAEEQPVQAGSVIFVEAHADHRFFDITEDLEVLVFFAPPETE